MDEDRSYPKPWYVWVLDAGGHYWRQMSGHKTREGAKAFMATAQTNSVRGTRLKVAPWDWDPPKWSVYERSPGVELWVWISEWGVKSHADTAARLKRLQNNDKAYAVYPTGEEPRPDNVTELWPKVKPDDTVEDMRDRQAQIALVADGIRERVMENPNRCRATRQNTGDICVRYEGHSLDKSSPNGGHLSPMEQARQQFRQSELEPEGAPDGSGWSAGRKWAPPHSESDYFEGHRPGDPRDPGEDPDEDVTPAGQSWAWGDPNRANRGRE